MDLSSRQCTGRTFLVKISGPTRANIEREIRARVAPQSTVWTDGHRAYKWMGMQNSGYSWDSVIHQRREFSKRGANGERVSTNAIEGLFSRLKKFFRTVGMTKISKTPYPEFIGEFMWRERFLSARVLGGCDWHSQAFFRIADLLGEEHKTHALTKLNLENAAVYKLPEDVQAQIENVVLELCPDPPSPPPVALVQPAIQAVPPPPVQVPVASPEPVAVPPTPPASRAAFSGALRGGEGICIELSSDDEDIEMLPPPAVFEPDIAAPRVEMPEPTAAPMPRRVPIGIRIPTVNLPSPSVIAQPPADPPWLATLVRDSHYNVKYHGGQKRGFEDGTFRRLVYVKRLGGDKLQFFDWESQEKRSYFIGKISRVLPLPFHQGFGPTLRSTAGGAVG